MKTQRASEIIYEQIKELIVSGQFKPGERLPSERTLMEMLQRSRPTIRETLRMLERSGFIRISHGTNGAIVQELGTEELEQSLDAMLRTCQVSISELVEYRHHNDTAVARWAALRRSESDIAEIRAVLDQGQGLLDQQDYTGFIQTDGIFHHLLAKSGKNQVSSLMSLTIGKLVKPILLKNLSEGIVLPGPEMCQSILSAHRKIFEAVRLGESAAAEAAMAEHLNAFRDDFNAGIYGG